MSVEQQIDLASYLKIIKRRKWHFLLPTAAVLILAAVISFALPSIYRSEATILVEAQEIPEEMVQSTVTGYVEERIQAINQVVLSRANLQEIIDRFGLYQSMRRSSTTEEIVAKMREDISMTPVQAEVSNPESGRTGMATIAFTLAYEGKDPRKVAQVANTLVSLFLEENAQQREEKAETTVQFLQTQIDQLKQEIAVNEQEIASFKDEHLLAMPELMDFNLQMMNRLEDRIDQKREEIKILEDRRIYLQGQLATLEPVKYSVSMNGQRALTIEEELKQMRSRYMALKAAHSPRHPDVVRLKKQIEAMEQELKVKGELKQVRQDLVTAQTRLSQLKKKYSSRHPDVIKAVKEVEELEERTGTLKASQDISQGQEGEPDNPSYINLQTQITQAEMEIGSIRQEMASLRTRHNAFQKRIEQTPKIEQEYKALLRDYENARAKYQETRSRLMAAKEAKELEKDRISQKLTLIDPPAIPEQPAKPNRLALLLVGSVLSVGFGVGSGSLAEFLDGSLHTPQALSNLTSRSVLTSIPYLVTPQEKRARRRRTVLIVSLIVALCGLGLAAVHLLFMPLDVIWILVQRKIQFMF